MMQKFSIELTIHKEDIDDLNHVNNAVYVKWMNDVAKTHWTLLSKNHNLDDYIWVVSRHEIDYKSEAFFGDKITAKTWVGETRGVTSERFIAFYKNEVLLAKAKKHSNLFFLISCFCLASITANLRFNSIRLFFSSSNFAEDIIGLV